MSLRAGAAAARAFARAAAVETQAPAILTCAVSGGVATGNPNQPATRADVIAAALSAAEAGASVVHVHARGVTGGLAASVEDYLTIGQAIRERVDVVLNFSAGAALNGTGAGRPPSLSAQPELVTLGCGSMNFGAGDDLLLNPPSAIAELAGEMARLEIVPEYECFDIGMAVTAAKLASSPRGAGGMMHMILGVSGGAPASTASISLFAELVPPGVPWAVTAITRHFPLMAVTLALGGHVRTGLEDVLYTTPGEYAPSNAHLITRARALCDAIGRPLATPADAREILGVAAVR